MDKQLFFSSYSSCFFLESNYKNTKNPLVYVSFVSDNKVVTIVIGALLYMI